MSAIPYACRAYPDDYSVSMPLSTLQSIQKPVLRTHQALWAERLHTFTEALMTPGYFNMQSLARIITPQPGSHKQCLLRGLAIRVGALAVWALTLLPALACLFIAAPLRLIEHRYRPAISYLRSSSASLQSKSAAECILSEDKPLHIRTHNLGLVPTSISTLGDLRNPVVRAREIAKSIEQDPHQPDIIFFQEVFNEAATKTLCHTLKNTYPHILHHIAPHPLGLSSGFLVASKYPIEEADFHRFNNMIGPERLSPRGILRVRIKSAHGPVLLYGNHLQAALGESRAKARQAQLRALHQLIDKDKSQEPDVLQAAMGDFNIARITPWGDDLLNPSNQSEAGSFQILNQFFQDLYLKDHDPLTGVRTEGAAHYLASDNQRLGRTLPEPSGSWYHGPLHRLHPLYGLKLRLDRKKHKRVSPNKAPIQIANRVWGTPQWHADQTANTSRFDYVLLPKQQGPLTLNGRVEIRRTIVDSAAQSASSDHLPVDAQLWIQK